MVAETTQTSGQPLNAAPFLLSGIFGNAFAGSVSSFAAGEAESHCGLRVVSPTKSLGDDGCRLDTFPWILPIMR